MRIPVAISFVTCLLLAPAAHELMVDLPTGDDLVAAVAARTLERAGAAEPIIEVQPRSTADWGFGSVVRPTPGIADTHPLAWLFVAHRESERWRVALEGEAEFARLSAQAPILAAQERRILGANVNAAAVGVAAAAGVAASEVMPVNGGQGGGGAAAYGDRRTGIGLPFAVGASWQFASGPHPMSDEGPHSALDLAGGDGVVRAAADGIAYTMCGGRGWVRILHDRGFATDYYHLDANIDVDGAPVRTGDVLGHTGNDVSCGGYSTGAHVHFSLLRFGEYVDLDGYSLGGWMVSAGAEARAGTLRHGSTVVGVGDLVHNYGPQPLDQGVVDTGGRGWLPLRTGPGDRFRSVDWVPDGTSLTVVCSVRGTLHRGRAAYPTTLWNRLDNGTYVPDALLATGTSGPVRGYCP